MKFSWKPIFFFLQWKKKRTFETGQQSKLTPLSLSLSPIHIYTYFIRLSSRAPPQPSPYNRSSTLLPSSILYPSFGGKASIIQAVGNCDRRILLESDTLACLLNKWWNNIFKTPIIRGRVSPSPYGGPVFIGPWSINAAKKEERSFIGVEGGEGGEPRSPVRFLLYNRTAHLPNAGLLRPFIRDRLMF